MNYIPPVYGVSYVPQVNQNYQQTQDSDFLILDDEPQTAVVPVLAQKEEDDFLILDVDGPVVEFEKVKSQAPIGYTPISVLAKYMVPPSYEKLWEESVSEFEDVDRFFAEKGISAILPVDRRDIFRPFYMLKISEIKLVIIGQDPYPNPNHACGLAFSIPPRVHPLPPAITNIYKQMEKTIPGWRKPLDGDLTYLAVQGVLLLNTSLTITPGVGKDGSHGQIWVGFISRLLSYINDVNPTCVFALWGIPAKKLREAISKRIPRACFVEASHPSSANYGGNTSWFEHNNFNEINHILMSQGKTPISW